MTNLLAERGLEVYLQRMKSEEMLRALKTLLGLDKMIHKNENG